jgi:hypothetical protein
MHIHHRVLQPGAGSPVALLERAVDLINVFERDRSRFAIKAVILDFGSAQQNAAAMRIAYENGIDHVIWQDPDHEAFLLRHLPGCQSKRPPKGASLTAIRQEWPEYNKGMSAQLLGQRINLDCLRAACGVENELRKFLRSIELI